MGLPKRKNNINVYPSKKLMDRREELLSNITDQDTRLPEPVLHPDLDKGFLDFAKENFQFELGGNQLNMIDRILTIQRWGEIASSNDFIDKDEKLELPFVSVIRNPETQFGTNPSLIYNIPNRRPVYYRTIKTFDGNRVGADVYQIPQPIPVDVMYDVYVVANRLREINEFNRKIMRLFSSRQSYTIVKGHYIPIVLEGVTDESPISNTEKRRYYKQVYRFNLQGFLIDDEEFKVTPAINRHLLVTEISGAPLKTKIVDRQKTIVRNFNLFTDTFLLDGNTTTLTTKDKINMLLYVSYNGQVLLQNVDYFHNYNTSNINLNFTPQQGDEIIISYSNNDVITDIDGNVRSLVTEEITLIPNQSIINLMYETDSILFLDVNGQIQNQGQYFSHQPNTDEITILQPNNSTPTLQVKYIPLTNAVPSQGSLSDIKIVNVTLDGNTNQIPIPGDFVLISSVSINNQIVTAYEFNNNILEFTNTPSNGSVIRVIYFTQDKVENIQTTFSFYTDIFTFNGDVSYPLTQPFKDILFLSINGLILNSDDIFTYDETTNSFSINTQLTNGDEVTIKYLLDN